MPGFRSDHINLIAANLRDRYKSGFPILKELIQNADDARASGLVFGYHPGFAEQSEHPLLHGPALWALNDGEFKESDKRAIQSFGLNSKAGESGAIGKFGLGMKSVFHLCEAFFYVAFDDVRSHGVILNPWFDPEGEDLFHNRWEQVADEDFERMHEIATDHRQVEPGKSYLQLWLPLRMRTHVPQLNGKPYGAIIDKFPGDDPSQELAFLHEASGTSFRADTRRSWSKRKRTCWNWPATWSSTRFGQEWSRPRESGPGAVIERWSGRNARRTGWRHDGS